MKGLVEYLAKALVDNPTPVEVFEAQPTPSSADASAARSADASAARSADASAGREAIFRLKVAREDLGKVIGKKGRTAKAFRTLLAAAGAKQNTRVTLEILEPEGGAPSPSEQAPGADDASE